MSEDYQSDGDQFTRKSFAALLLFERTPTDEIRLAANWLEINRMRRQSLRGAEAGPS
jgi:hypothetical protein